MRHIQLPPTAAFIVLLGLVSVVQGKEIDYLTDVKPILQEKCYSCHGVLKQEAGLRLETRSLMVDGSAITPGEPTRSELLSRIISVGDDRMPPEHEGTALKPDQIRIVEQWISQGAPAPNEAVPVAPDQHWAFVKPSRSRMSRQTTGLDSRQNPIDRILSKRREDLGTEAVERSPRSLLIRRLYLDLIGLPPTHEQLADGRDWDLIVDELLASPAHGERWARHWMDIWRYSDWYGLNQQIRYSQKHLWHWRDWIINALNDDKPYDRMLMEMVAGDEIAPADPDVIAATGFLARNYYLFNRTTWLDHTIEHTGKAFLGLTLNCAKCHDHKYDPVSQLDYYRYRAIFEPHQVRLDPVPGVTDFELDGLPRVFDDSIERKTFLHLKGDPQNPDKERDIMPGVPAIFAEFAAPIEPIRLPIEAYAPGTRKSVQAASVADGKEAIRKAEEQYTAAKTRVERRPQSVANNAAANKNVDEGKFNVSDDFDGPNPKLWETVGAEWEYQNGALLQTVASRDAESVRLIPKLPVNFEVECTYTVTGGATYKSVTFRFDESEDRKTANYIYTSAHAPGPKVQAAFTRQGKNTYPADGRKLRPIEIGHPYRLRFAVRETLINVYLDDQFVLAYEFPERLDGRFSINGFDATVAFDSIAIRSLPKQYELKPASNSKLMTQSDLKQAVVVAERKLALAKTELAATRETIKADNARYRNATPPEVLKSIVLKAAESQLRVSIANAEHRIAAEGSDPKKLKAAEKEKAEAIKQLSEVNAGNATYQSLRGSKKALESPAHKEGDYPSVYSSISTGRRTALARWLVSEQNPLTARVAVNHVWMRHFGKPLVESVFDFGLRTPPPANQQLLDFLAVEFMDSGWSFKRLHRLIVTSHTYQLASTIKQGAVASQMADRDNSTYWHFPAKRMESQVVRDSLLSLAGQLDPSIGGPSIDPSNKTHRRSVYLKHSRDQQDKFLAMFDDADILQCYRRSESIVPQQALAMSNSRLAIEMSNVIAQRISLTVDTVDRIPFVDAAFDTILCRPPDNEERQLCESFFDELLGLSQYANLSSEEQILRTRARLINALVNHNDFVTIR